MDPLVQVVAYKYALKFPSPGALKRYFQKHPKADKSKHTVQKSDGKAPAKEEKGDEDAPAKEEKGGGGILGKLKGKLSKMSDSAKKVLTESPKAVQTFFTDPASRRASMQKASEAISAAPGKYVDNLVKTAKHEIKEFKEAGQGIAAVMKGGKMSKEQKHATKAVAKHLALIAGAAVFSAAGTAAFAGFMGKTMIKHIALKAAAESLADIHNLSKVGIIGQGLIGIMTKLSAEEGKEVSPEDAFAALVMGKVLSQAKNLSDDDMADILEEIAKGQSKEAALRVAARFQTNG